MPSANTYDISPRLSQVKRRCFSQAVLLTQYHSSLRLPGFPVTLLKFAPLYSGGTVPGFDRLPY